VKYKRFLKKMCIFYQKNRKFAEIGTIFLISKRFSSRHRIVFLSENHQSTWLFSQLAAPVSDG